MLLEVVRWTSLMVLVAVAVVFAAFGWRMPMRTIYKWACSRSPCSSRELPGLLARDLLWHVGPVAVLGLPSVPCALSAPALAPLLIAYGALVAWYVAVRGRVREIYFPSAPLLAYDLSVFVVVPAGAVVAAGLAEALRRAARRPGRPTIDSGKVEVEAGVTGSPSQSARTG